MYQHLTKLQILFETNHFILITTVFWQDHTAQVKPQVLKLLFISTMFPFIPLAIYHSEEKTNAISKLQGNSKSELHFIKDCIWEFGDVPLVIHRDGAFRLGSGGCCEANGRKYSLANWKTSSGFLSSKNCKKSDMRARISGCCLRYEAWSALSSSCHTET